jgi:tRNA(fMet)-specific endonuclease VapC
MIAFDADVLTEILAGHVPFVERAAKIPVHEQAVPIIVIEEMLRGCLNSIRQAEAGKANLSIDRAYELFEGTLNAFEEVVVLSYSSAAELQYQEWRRQGLRIGTHDLRIAAICVGRSATLVTRNRRDFEQVPDCRWRFGSSFDATERHFEQLAQSK